MQSATSRSILIVEDNPDGHRLYYVSLLASVAAASGDSVTIGTTKEAVASPEWLVHIAPMSNQVGVVFLDDYSLSSIGATAQTLHIDHVVVPDGDSVVYELSRGKRWAGHGTITVLIMREKGQQTAVPGVALLTSMAKTALFLSASVRPKVDVRILKSATWRGFSMLPVSRDPVTLTPAVLGKRATLLPCEAFWFGVVGKVGHRKNLPLVAAAIASLGRGDVGLIVAGQVDQGVIERARPHIDQIRRNGGAVQIVDRLLGDSEIDHLVADLDCVVLAHSNDGPSGILGKAVAAGTRVVAAGASTLKSDCRHIGSGAQWVALRPEPISKALARALEIPRPRPRLLASPTEFASELLGLSQ